MMTYIDSLPTTQPIELIYPDNAPEAFHLLAKPTGAICNLDCAYCFFLEKEQLYPGSKFRMSDELLEQYIKQLIEAHRANQVNHRHRLGRGGHRDGGS